MASNLWTLTYSAHLDSNTDPSYEAAWYERYHYTLNTLSKETPHTKQQIICAFAALSPLTHIDRNEQLLHDLLETGDCAHQSGDAINKAKRCLNSPDPYTILRGHKVKSFASNLLRPFTPGAVTIDRHAYSILLARPTSDQERKILSRVGTYQLLAGVFRSVAREFDLLPHELQALTWVYYRKQLNDQDPTTDIGEF